MCFWVEHCHCQEDLRGLMRVHRVLGHFLVPFFGGAIVLNPCAFPPKTEPISIHNIP